MLSILRYTLSKSLPCRNCASNLEVVRTLKHKINSIELELDSSYLVSENQVDMEQNILKRKNSGNLTLIKSLMTQLKDSSANAEVFKQLQSEIRKLPNTTHPDVIGYGEDPVEIRSYGNKPEFSFKPKSFAELCKRLNILRTEHLGNFTGTKTYYLMNDLAELVCCMSRKRFIYTINISICFKGTSFGEVYRSSFEETKLQTGDGTRYAAGRGYRRMWYEYFW